MKLRYERGALADLDEIFAYIAADSREAAGALSLVLKKWRRGLQHRYTLEARHASPASYVFRLANI
jgi:plasmid stabilization system protein ParE